MTSSIRIVALPGSLRQGSYNLALVRAAASLMPPGAELAVETIRGVPLYDGDEEAASGLPPRVLALKEAVASADGLLLATPEYNNSLPGVLKNAIDWMTRPPKDAARVFGGKPVALVGATTGGLGTVLAQDAWLPVLRALGMRPWFGGRMLASRAATLFDAEGALTDQTTREALQKFLAGFVAFVKEQKKG